MVILRNAIISFLIVYAAWVLVVQLNFYWFSTYINDREFQTVLGFTHIPTLISWIPKVVVYLLVGIAVFRVVRSPNPFGWVIAAAVFVTIVLLFSLRVYFTEHSTVIDRLFNYAEYVIPGIAILIGGYLKGRKMKKLTNHSTGRPQAGAG